MDKGISAIRSENKRIKTMPETILDKYEVLVSSSDSELSTERLYKFLTGDKVRVMNRSRRGGTLDNQTLEESKKYAAFYSTRVSQQTRRSILRRFEGLPFFLRAGMYEPSKSPQSFPWNPLLDLTNEQLMQVDSFV